ncbi:hypothetical protein EDB86DRAFT_3002938 [Lactarius hatsudake]|nr:hypothetical protein EDB86DRAFT_3002938 [Lactarius hatsudake]
MTTMRQSRQSFAPFIARFCSIGSLHPTATLSVQDGQSQTPQPTNNRTITFVIEHRQRPLLLIDVKPPSDFHLDSRRQGAISQIKQYLDEVGPTNQYVERLYAISAIRKRWRAGYTTKGKGSKGAQPVRGVASVNSLKSAGPDCWNPDITSNDSWALLKSIVDTIKGYVTPM